MVRAAVARVAWGVAAWAVLAAAGARADEPGAEESFGAVAHVPLPDSSGTRVSTEEARDMPAAFGDPLRVVDALPGAVPAISGVPYVYLRGAPPATTGYVYDDIAMPQLFHLALGPAVMHPRMIGSIELHSGVPPARYGRRLGGLVRATRAQTSFEPSAELELRLLDVNGFVEVPGEHTELTLAGRYGYPGLLASAISPDVELSYWDYQMRMRTALSSQDSFEVVALGSFDHLDQTLEEDARTRSLDLEFHRLDVRLVRDHLSWRFGSAVQLGWDDSVLDDDLQVQALSVSPRVWFDYYFDGESSLRVGGDFMGSVGSIDSRQFDDLTTRSRRIRLDVPVYADVPARSAGGAYAELHLEPARFMALDLGVRGDVWLVQQGSDTAVDPRARMTVWPADKWQLHAAVGLTHQPVTFLVPLPGLTETSIDRGLQRAVQSEVGLARSLPLQLQLEVQGFVHRYWDLSLPEMYTPDEDDALPRADVLSYGAEVFLRRSHAALRGWVSYTLGWAQASEPPDGRHFRPTFDVRHVVNLVLQYRLEGGLEIGSRVHYRSGRPVDQFTDQGIPPSYDVVLASFARLDARVGYRWKTGWGRMLAYLEWLNVTLAKEQLGADCFYGTCMPQTAPAIFFPNAGVRAQF